MCNAEQIFASSFMGILQIKIIKADELLFKKRHADGSAENNRSLFLEEKKTPDMKHKHISLGDTNRGCQVPSVAENILSYLKFVWKSRAQT